MTFKTFLSFDWDAIADIVIIASKNNALNDS